MIEARGLVRAFDDDPAVAGIDLDVHPGEIHAIVGLNGAGKTTLMRLLLGMTRPDEGSVSILHRSPTDEDSELWSRVGHHIGAPLAWPELTVTENLWAAALLHGLSDDEAQTAARRSADRFELGRWADRRAGALSMGNRQRLGLAAALLHDPTVLVLDEPTNALDPAGVLFVRSLLVDTRDRGGAILVSSHHLDELARVADRITVMHRGRIVGTLDPDGIDLERRFFEAVYEAEAAR